MPQPTGTAAREVELKLLVMPDDLARIQFLPALQTLAISAPVQHPLRTVYYDTQDLKLAKSAVALRLRADGDHFEQTIKTLTDDGPSDSAGVAVRREWTWTLSSDTPDLSRLERDGAGGLIPADIRCELLPLFETTFTRTTFLIRPDSRTTVEVAIDDGWIIAGDRRQRISELELELIDGRMGRLFQLAQAILHHIPVRIATENKAEIGYRLVTATEPAAKPAETIALAPATTVAEAFRHIIRNAIRQVLANQASVIEAGEVEGLHQIRIALRRLRVALRLFQPVIPSPHIEEMRQELRWAIGSLSLARDWDVLASDILGPLTTTETAPAGVAALASAVATARRGPARAAVDALSGVRFSRLILGLCGWLEDGRWLTETPNGTRATLDGPMASLATLWLQTHMVKARKAGRSLESGGTIDRSRLRARLRRLAYAVEFFRGLYPAAQSRAYLATIAPLSETLDRIHDHDSADHLLERVSEMSGAADSVREMLANSTQLLARTLPDQWRDFVSATVFW